MTANLRAMDVGVTVLEQIDTERRGNVDLVVDSLRRVLTAA
jgi:hypothetical protein